MSDACDEQAKHFAKQAWQYRAHHERFVRFVERRKLHCMECGGAGGWTEPVLDYGVGPWEQCAWCEGTGYMTPADRGLWLRHKRELKRELEQLKRSPSG